MKSKLFCLHSLTNENRESSKGLQIKPQNNPRTVWGLFRVPFDKFSQGEYPEPGQFGGWHRAKI